MRRAQDRARSARSRKNGARSATIESRALGALKLASEASWREARYENVPAKRADFLSQFHQNVLYAMTHYRRVKSTNCFSTNRDAPIHEYRSKQ